MLPRGQTDRTLTGLRKIQSDGLTVKIKYDLRDSQFILKEWIPMEEVLDCDRFKDNYGLDDADMYLNEGYKVASEMVSPINAERATVTPVNSSQVNDAAACVLVANKEKCDDLGL